MVKPTEIAAKQNCNKPHDRSLFIPVSNNIKVTKIDQVTKHTRVVVEDKVTRF